MEKADSGAVRVSFVMCAYNAASTVGETVASVLAQTMTNIELVVVDDGSTDGTSEVIRKVADSRVRLVRNERNEHISRAANRGLSLARGRYVARVDGDDICLPERAAVQSRYLDGRPDVAIVGAAMEPFSTGAGGGGAVELMRYPTGEGAASSSLLFRNSVAQPAVMFRKAALEEHGLLYRDPYRCAHDYDLWCRCVARGMKIANLPEVLVRYRIHAQQITQVLSQKMQSEAEEIRNELLVELGLSPTGEDCVVHNDIARDRFSATQPFVDRATAWLVRLATCRELRGRFEREALLRVLTGRFVALVRFARKAGLPVEARAREVFAAYLLPGALD